MNIKITPMRAVLALLYTSIVVLVVVAFGRLGVFSASAASASSGNVANAQILTIDPDLILKRFVEERAINLEGDAFNNAVRKLDLIVAQEAIQTYAEYGVLVVKSDLVLAGGTDYTNAFYARVLAIWDGAL